MTYSTLKRTGRLKPRSDKRVQQDAAYKPIHDAVIERDGGCVVGIDWPETPCFGSIVVHHIISRARAPLLALDPDNLLATCVQHHLAIHVYPELATDRGFMASAPVPTFGPRPDADKTSSTALTMTAASQPSGKRGIAATTPGHESKLPSRVGAPLGPAGAAK